MLTPRQTNLVQQTWSQVVPIADTAAALFYGRLFELDPSLRSLFTSDLKEQGKKLMQMIGMAVKGLDDPQRLIPAVRDLGRRHTGYGVRDEHYDTVGSALLWTLQRGLGEAFTPDVEEAWAVTYGLLAGTMKDAAAEPSHVTAVS